MPLSVLPRNRPELVSTRDSSKASTLPTAAPPPPPPQPMSDSAASALPACKNWRRSSRSGLEKFDCSIPVSPVHRPECGSVGDAREHPPRGKPAYCKTALQKRNGGFSEVFSPAVPK